jgi:hypothetical protein
MPALKAAWRLDAKLLESPGVKTELMVPNRPPGGGGIGMNWTPVQYATIEAAAGCQTSMGGSPADIASANIKEAKKPCAMPLGPGRVRGKLPGIKRGLTNWASE